MPVRRQVSSCTGDELLRDMDEAGVHRALLTWHARAAARSRWFGPHRMSWGTDITRMPCTWRQGVTMFTEELPWLKGRGLEPVMGRALCEWIGWKTP